MPVRRIADAVSGLPVVGEFALRLNRSPRIFGPRYRARFNEFPKTDWEGMLLRIVNQAVRNVPFYRSRCSEEPVQSLADFTRRFPTIDKEVVLANFDDFLADDINIGRYDACTTGGTSGRPLRLMLPKDRYVHEYAALHRLWGQVGFNFSPRAVVRNKRISNRDYVVNPVLREYVFDGFRSSSEYFHRIYDVMRTRKIRFFHGYTSNAHAFAKFLVEERLDYSFLRAFITSSEQYHEHQRAAFMELEGVDHLNFYGHSEKLVLGALCPSTGLYHFHDQYGFCELLNEAGESITRVGEVGEIVGSTLYNAGMPLLRYRTGDHAIFAGRGVCESCGHVGLSASALMGRWNGDRIYNADGSYITTTALNLHSHLYERINGLQYVQEVMGRLIVRVVPGPAFDASVARQLQADVASKLHPGSVVDVVEVTSIERKQNGKYLLLLSSVSEEAQRR